MSHPYRNYVAQFGPLGVALAGVAVIAWMLWYYSSPPIQYSQAVYEPERSRLCPGEQLVYTNTLTVDRAALVPFNLAWWSVDLRRFAGPPEAVQYRPFPGPASLTARRANVVPDLPPGQYELWFVAGIAARSAAGHVVPFTIPEGC